MNDDKNQESEIIKRLDAILGLLRLDLLSNEKIGTSLIYKSMHNAGLTPAEIGKIVGREGKDISANITMYEKKKKQQRTKRQVKGRSTDE